MLEETRQAGVQIAEEMIEAGVEVLASALVPEDGFTYRYRALAKDVFDAMASLALEQAAPS